MFALRSQMVSTYRHLLRRAATGWACIENHPKMMFLHCSYSLNHAFCKLGNFTM